MQLSETVKIYPTKYQSELIKATMSIVSLLIALFLMQQVANRLLKSRLQMYLQICHPHGRINVFVMQNLSLRNTIKTVAKPSLKIVVLPGRNLLLE